MVRCERPGATKGRKDEGQGSWANRTRLRGSRLYFWVFPRYVYWSNVQDGVPLGDLGEVLSADGSNRVVRFAKKEVKDKAWTLDEEEDLARLF